MKLQAPSLGMVQTLAIVNTWAVNQWVEDLSLSRALSLSHRVFQINKMNIFLKKRQYLQKSI